MTKKVCIIDKGGRSHSWGEDLHQGFIELGYEATILALRHCSFEKKRLENELKLRCRENHATVQRLAETIRTCQPALIIILNTIDLPEQAHTALRKAARGASMISWLEDHAQDLPAGCLPNLDADYAFDSATLPLLEKFYQYTQTKLSDLSLEINLLRFQNRGIPIERRCRQLVFIRNHSPDRKKAIRNLKSLGVKVASDGSRTENGWQVWKRLHAKPFKASKLYGAHRAVCNMLQFPNTIHKVNFRAYEIPACGGICTYPLTPDLPISFEPHDEVSAYRDLPDLAAQIETRPLEKTQSQLRLSQKTRLGRAYLRSPRYSLSRRMMSARIRVKFLSRVRLPDGNIGAYYLRRFPNREPVWGKCQFIFDPDCREYNWLFVYDNLPRNTKSEKLASPPRNTLLLTDEPSSITYDCKSFLKQFRHVLTSQEPRAIKHPNVIRRQAGLLWYDGGSDERGTDDSLAAARPPQKSKLLSTVCSSKAMRHTLHSIHLHFTKPLMAELPVLDVFGYGMGHLVNKADAIDPYKYQLVIENHSRPHHWTEKLTNAFLRYSLPVCFGGTSLGEYFPEERYVWIDVRNYGESLASIRSLVSGEEYEKRLSATIEARRLVMKNYSTFVQISGLINKISFSNYWINTDAVIMSRRESRRRDPLSLPSEWILQLSMKTSHRRSR